MTALGARKNAVFVVRVAAVAALLFWVTSSLDALMANETSAKDCPLKAPLIVKDTQDGFAGPTGTIWTISEDCSFTVARQLGPKVLPPERQGRLTADQQARLNSALERAALEKAPADIGVSPPVNARRITVTSGDKTTVLSLPPGGDARALSFETSEAGGKGIADLLATVNELTRG